MHTTREHLGILLSGRCLSPSTSVAAMCLSTWAVGKDAWCVSQHYWESGRP